MTSALLQRLYGVTAQVVARNTAGITHPESLRSPGPAGNPANWVLGHIVVHRDVVLELLGEKPTWGPAERDLYDRGTSLPASPLPFERILADFHAQHERLQAALGRLDDARLAEPVEKETLGWRIAFLAYHEGYHGGQLGLLRRLLGKPGAIG